MGTCDPHQPAPRAAFERLQPLNRLRSRALDATDFPSSGQDQTGQIPYLQLTYIPDHPHAQVMHTLGVMRRFALDDSAKAEAIAIANQLRSRCGSDMEYCVAVWQLVKSKLQFVQDAETGESLTGIAGVTEALARPVEILSGRVTRGDCDDYATTAACLLTACAIPCSFVIVAADQLTPYRFSHVYCAAYPDVDGCRVRFSMDCSHGKFPGWEVAPEKVFNRDEYPVYETGSRRVVQAALTFALAYGIAAFTGRMRKGRD